MTIHVDVKWKNELFENIELSLSEPLLLFKSQLFSLTGVPPERQKLMFKGLLKDDVDLSHTGLCNGSKILLIGSGQVLNHNSQVKFIEDLPMEEKDALLGIKTLQLKSAGLVNVGNTCYFNAVMQFLLPVKELWDKLELFNNIPGIEKNELVGSILALSNTMKNDIKPVTPVQQVRLLRQLYPTFNKIDQTTGQYMQQDAEECLNFIINTMNEFSSGCIADEIFGYTVVVKSERLDGIDEFIPHQNDNIKHMFLRCTMGNQTNPVNSIMEGIKNTLTELVTINKDGADVLYKKVSYINSLPDYLIIHLLRFEWKQASATSMTQACKAKVCKRISFDKKLDVSCICEKDLEESLGNINKYIYDIENGFTPTAVIPRGLHKNGNYVLEAVITHQGRTADGGHYVTWTRVNDESIDDDLTNLAHLDNKNGFGNKDEKNNETDKNVEMNEDVLPKKQAKEPKEFWYKFDDDEISKFDFQSIDLCGGRSDYHIAILLLYKAQYVTIKD